MALQKTTRLLMGSFKNAHRAGNFNPRTTLGRKNRAARASALKTSRRIQGSRQVRNSIIKLHTS